ncbi:disulfide bond formation protein B [Pseudomonadales bacterium]|nr:disulfide bond formation protein B [Pseudomonadales bacterium]
MLESWKSEQWALAICILSGGLLCIGLVMEHAMGLSPCPLCMMQRIWLALVGLTAYASLAHSPRWGIYPLVGGVFAIIGSGFSLRQIWLQNLPKDQVPSCGPDLAYMIESFPLSDLLAAMTSGTGDCAEVSWSLLGLSIPAWLFAAFMVLLFGCVMQIRQGIK